jgi:hypothetical protein
MDRDAAVTEPPFTDGQVLLPDAAVPKTDTGLISADPDTAPYAPDAAIVVSDSAIVPFDTALPVSDGPTIDGPTKAPNPYANRSFRIDPEHPAPTPDATCTEYGPTDYYQFTFGADITTVTVLMVRGSAAQAYHATAGPEASKLTYHFTDWTPGGTITFERDKGVEVAQVIMRGSGLPVIRCLRGVLLPQP